jgi:glycosyltransferase involved in cell wall biosynthesis
MKVSVIVRTCSRPDFLEQALASIQLQTHKDWEVIIFDDGDNSLNQKIVNEFKDRTDNLVTYINSGKSYHLFKESWKMAPKIANGEIMIRLDDDDLLDFECLEFVSKVFTETSDLDFAYGASVFFRKNNVTEFIPTKTPLDFPKSKDIWEGYIKGHPHNQPWRFKSNYYDEPKHISSIIHASKLNQMCVWHPYIMRTKSVLKVVDKVVMSSNFVDDLEFLGSLDNLGLGYNKLEKILTYVRKHDKGSITDSGKKIGGLTLWDDILRVRDTVDFLRPDDINFQSKIVEINSDGNHNDGVTDELKNRFKNMLFSIDNVLNPPQTFQDKFDWRAF